MDNMLTQLDDDALDQVSGGTGIDIGGSIGLNGVGAWFAKVAQELNSLPVFSWDFSAGFHDPE